MAGLNEDGLGELGSVEKIGDSVGEDRKKGTGKASSRLWRIRVKDGGAEPRFVSCREIGLKGEPGRVPRKGQTRERLVHNMRNH